MCRNTEPHFIGLVAMYLSFVPWRRHFKYFRIIESLCIPYDIVGSYSKQQRDAKDLQYLSCYCII
jgi:hypothetical protein